LKNKNGWGMILHHFIVDEGSKKFLEGGQDEDAR
jgi:hypothetical protein